MTQHLTPLPEVERSAFSAADPMGTISSLTPSNLTTGKAALEQGAVERAIAAAKNPYASSHVNQAVQQFIEYLLTNESPAFDVTPSARNRECAARYIEDIARLANNLVFNIARDADVKASRTIFSDALHDSDLPGDLENA